MKLVTVGEGEVRSASHRERILGKNSVRAWEITGHPFHQDTLRPRTLLITAQNEIYKSSEILKA